MAVVLWTLAGLAAVPAAIVLVWFLQAAALYRKYPIPALLQIRRSRADYVPLEQMGTVLPATVLLLEDKVFYSHRGFDRYGIFYALKQNLKAGKIVRGGSTITQQLVKNLYFSFAKSYRRKAMELFLALKTERLFSKDQILELYLNMVSFGCGQWGVGNAARYYFDRPVHQLTEAQCLMLAAILPAPDHYSPLRSSERYEKARDQALRLLQENGLSPEQAHLLQTAPLGLTTQIPSPRETVRANLLAADLRNQLHQGR